MIIECHCYQMWGMKAIFKKFNILSRLNNIGNNFNKTILIIKIQISMIKLVLIGVLVLTIMPKTVKVLELIWINLKDRILDILRESARGLKIKWVQMI